MSEQAPRNRRDLEAQLMARAWKDDAFRQELIRNPKPVLEREMARWRPGYKLPDTVEVKVLEETPTTRYLVLPSKPQFESTSGELSDEDLEQVAGGGQPSYTECDGPDCTEDTCRMLA